MQDAPSLFHMSHELDRRWAGAIVSERGQGDWSVPQRCRRSLGGSQREACFGRCGLGREVPYAKRMMYIPP